MLCPRFFWVRAICDELKPAGLDLDIFDLALQNNMLWLVSGWGGQTLIYRGLYGIPLPRP